MFATRTFATAALLLATAGFSTPLLAETREDMSFDGMVAMPRMDKNKDGMVSKKEFMDTMSKVWDDKARKMGAKGGMMSGEDFKQVLMYLKAGS